MSAKQIIMGSDVVEKVLSTVRTVGRIIGGTMGPEGNYVAIESSYGAPKVTKDGVTVAESIELPGSFENIVAKMIIEAAKGTVEKAGDGTTGATVEAAKMISEGIKHVVSGMDPMGISRGIKKAVDSVVEALKDMSKPCADAIAIEQVGTISSNGDVGVGKMIASAVDKVGKDGVIMVQEGDSIEDLLDIQKGMQHDRGYISPYFITNPQEKTAEFENPYILIVEKTISNEQDIISLLQKVTEQDRALFIISESVEGAALPCLVLNRMRGAAKVCAVKAPGFGENRKAILEDIAVFTKATVVSEEIGLTTKDIELSHLGTAKRVVVTNNSFTIIDGGGDQTAIDGHVAGLRRDYKAADSSYEKEKKQERLAKLSGGIAIIKVGAPAELEMKEKKYRLEDALSATRAAIEEGIVPGGGVALLRAAKVLEHLKGDNSDEDAGIAIVRESVKAPLYQIIQNTGREPAVIAHEVINGKHAETNINYGYNAAKDVYGDMIEMGIIDPTKVVRTALQQAASVAGVLLNVKCIVADLPKKDSAQGGMPSGMGGMGGDMDMM